jgi:hypothetical protein
MSAALCTDLQAMKIMGAEKPENAEVAMAK